MSLIERMENKIVKLEKNIEEEKSHIENLKEKYRNNTITKTDFLSIKKRIEGMIKTMDLRIRVLKGEVVKKRKKKNEKVRIRENRKMGEKSYFEWSKT